MTTRDEIEERYKRLLAEMVLEAVMPDLVNHLRFQLACDRAWFALKPRKPKWWERLLRVLVWSPFTKRGEA